MTNLELALITVKATELHLKFNKCWITTRADYSDSYFNDLVNMRKDLEKRVEAEKNKTDDAKGTLDVGVDGVSFKKAT